MYVCVCECVCLCVCVCVCMCVVCPVCVFVYACMHVSMHVCPYTHERTRAHKHLRWWGDEPVDRLAVLLLLPAEKVVKFERLPYWHQTLVVI